MDGSRVALCKWESGDIWVSSLHNWVGCQGGRGGAGSCRGWFGPVEFEVAVGDRQGDGF